MTLEEITSAFEYKGSGLEGMDPESVRVILEFMEDYNVARIFTSGDGTSAVEYGVKFL